VTASDQPFVQEILSQFGMLRLYYRQDAMKQKTVSIKFTHKLKISIFATQGCTPVALIHVKIGTTKGHVGPLGHTKNFMPVSSRGWEHGPQNIKNFNFLVKSRLAGANPLTDF